MTSTKVMFLGILIMLLGSALVSTVTQMVAVRAIGFDATILTSLAYIAFALFVVGFIVGVIGFFRK